MKVGDMQVIGATIKQEEFLKARGEFAKQYCEKKGWPTEAEKLSFEQILEIRAQDGWKQPKS